MFSSVQVSPQNLVSILLVPCFSVSQPSHRLSFVVSNWSSYSRPNLYYRPWAQMWSLVRK